MEIAGCLGAIKIKMANGKPVGMEYVTENDASVADALNRVKAAPQGAAQPIEGAPAELKNVAVVAVEIPD